LESLLICLSMEGCCVWWKNTAFLDVFTAASIIDYFWVISVTVESLIIILSIEGYDLWSTNSVLWNVLTAVSIIYVFWEFVSRDSSYKRRFGIHIAPIFGVPQGDRIPPLCYSGITWLATTHQWNPIILKNPEEGGDMFLDTSVLTGTTWYKFPEDIYNRSQIFSYYRGWNIRGSSRVSSDCNEIGRASWGDLTRSETHNGPNCAR
jgi:hypothetical protein